jgi:hypothetical protein
MILALLCGVAAQTLPLAGDFIWRRTKATGTAAGIAICPKFRHAFAFPVDQHQAAAARWALAIEVIKHLRHTSYSRFMISGSI